MSLPQFQQTQRAQQPAMDPITEEKNRLFQTLQRIPHRIGIHAGKGGVGKTFLATQLALILAKDGKRVGLIDADVDCPNVPVAYNLKEDMLVGDDGKLIPVEYGVVKIVSTGFMQQDEAIIIRGPIKHRLLTDFIEKTQWGDLDVLLFDFPPGTSDVPLSAMQVATLSGIILISTPQKSAMQDLKRATAMAKKLSVPIIGMVENMSGEVFGEDAVKQFAKKNTIPFLTSIPLSQEIREKAENGEIALSNNVQQELLGIIN